MLMVPDKKERLMSKTVGEIAGIISMELTATRETDRIEIILAKHAPLHVFAIVNEIARMAAKAAALNHIIA